LPGADENILFAERYRAERALCYGYSNSEWYSKIPTKFMVLHCEKLPAGILNAIAWRILSFQLSDACGILVA
jgi:hypothetical protein